MGDKSTIEWTEATWNPVTGCDRVSPGCANCYALKLAKRLKAMGQPRYQRDGDPKTSGPGFGVTLHPDVLEQPLRWTKPRMIFVNSMSDLFHPEIPTEFVDQVFDVMRRASHHTFQVLTKRPERALVDVIFNGEPLPNVWIGVSIENARFTWRADVLRQIPAAVRFISAEPLLGSLLEPGSSAAGDEAPESPTGPYPDAEPVGERQGGQPGSRRPLNLTDIDWVIVGGESGGKSSRPMHPDWALELRDACAPSCCGEWVTECCASPLPSGECCNEPVQACCEQPIPGPAFFFKQWGSWAPGEGDYAGSSLTGDRRVIREEILLDRRGRVRDTNELATFALPGDWARIAYAGAAPKSGGRLLDGRAWSEMPRA